MSLTNAHAVVIGVSQYRRIRPLPSVADAEGVAGVLRDPAACGYDPANVVLLQESDATRDQILDELDRLGQRADPGATAVVYFSGHGGTWPGGDSYLMPIDGDWSSQDRLDATAVPGRLLGDRLAAIRAERLTVILDCCHAAGLAQPRLVDDTWVPALADSALDRLATGRGRVVMAAARSDGASYVLAGARHGLFTEHLIAGLRGAAGSRDGVVRVLDLYHHVQRNVVARFPAQRPVLKAEMEDNYAVALCPSVAGPALTAAAAPGEFIYDVLLVHAPDDRDRAWARVFIQLLEERGVRVCTEDLDAELGGHRALELERLVSTSRFTLPVLTPRFSAGRFQDLQTVLAQQLGVEDGIARLIPVVREPCEARLGLRSLVHLEMIRDETVVPGIDRLVRTLRRQPARPAPR
jgi:caspase domain-containing protein/TIR domain-containing protein